MRSDSFAEADEAMWNAKAIELMGPNSASITIAQDPLIFRVDIHAAFMDQAFVISISEWKTNIKLVHQPHECGWRIEAAEPLILRATEAKSGVGRPPVVLSVRSIRSGCFLAML